MKKNMRNALAISGLALAIGASGFTLEASANMNSRSRIQRSHQERIVRTNKIKTEKISTSRRFIMGSVSAVSDNSISITRANKTYTVSTATDTRLLDRKWKAINLSDIQVGNKVRISGTITDLTVSAKTIRDISLPTVSTN